MITLALALALTLTLNLTLTLTLTLTLPWQRADGGALNPQILVAHEGLNRINQHHTPVIAERGAERTAVLGHSPTDLG